MIHQPLSDNAVVNVTEAQYVPPYKIRLQFSDSVEQTVNFEMFLKNSHYPEIKKYIDPKLFKDFSIAQGRMDWNDYDLCFSMQDLYEGTIRNMNQYTDAQMQSTENILKIIKLCTAMQLYKMQKLSMDKASELAELNKTDFMFELGRHEIPVINYDPEDFRDEMEWIMKK